MRDDYWTLSFPRLTQDTSDDSYPDSPKDDTMTTDQPAWATDPRGLPPAVQNRSGRTWGRSGETSYAGFTPTELEALHGPLTPLWPDTQPTSTLPDLSRWHPVPVGATIPAGTRFVIIWANGSDDDDFSCYVADPPGVTQRLGDNPRYTEHPIPAPDAWAADRIGLWSDSPPTPIDPADIKVGMRVRRVLRHKDGDRTTTTESTVTAVHPRLITLSECVYHLAEGGDWFLIEDAPDPDAHWIRAIAEATPETAPTVYAAIKGEQA